MMMMGGATTRISRITYRGKKRALNTIAHARNRIIGAAGYRAPYARGKRRKMRLKYLQSIIVGVAQWRELRGIVRRKHRKEVIEEEGRGGERVEANPEEMTNVWPVKKHRHRRHFAFKIIWKKEEKNQALPYTATSFCGICAYVTHTTHSCGTRQRTQSDMKGRATKRRHLTHCACALKNGGAHRAMKGVTCLPSASKEKGAEKYRALTREQNILEKNREHICHAEMKKKERSEIDARIERILISLCFAVVNMQERRWNIIGQMLEIGRTQWHGRRKNMTWCS